jgi:hypothetical protein
LEASKSFTGVFTTVIASIKGMLLIMESEPKGALAKQVADKDAKNICLACDKQCKPGSRAPDGRSRGLCLGEGGCYHKYMGRRRKILDEQKQVEFDAKLQRRGKLLESKQGERPDAKTVFDEVAEEVKS